MRELRPLFAGGAPEAPAVRDPAAGWLTYAELDRRVGALATALAARPRGLAFLTVWPDAGSVVAYLAAVAAGHAVALLDPTLAPAHRDRLEARYAPELFLESRPGGIEVRAGATPGDHPPPHPDLAALLPTSGSTGDPKLVRLSRTNLTSNAEAIAQALGIGPDERALLGLPFHYAYGLSVVNSHLAAGASTVLTADGVMAGAYWDLAKREACTTMPGVPFTYQALDRLGVRRAVPPTLRTLTQAGGRLDPAIVVRIHEAMAARGGRLFVMYGQTEATARIAVLPADALPEAAGAVGRAVPGGRLAIAPDTGEIRYEGPNVMLGYAEARADLARGDELGGRLATGDLGRLDAHGYLHVTGRAKRIAKLFGQRLNLDDVEAMASHLGTVAALEADDALVVVVEGTAEPDPAERHALAAALRLRPEIVALRRIDALPRTAAGKVDYPGLKALVARG